ncbi:FGGY-family carbohydrate kinase [Leucobacter triazinivorans]|uniref:Sugar kinase n=1 Tax=Leucobacter triazinivorans TaxID=1784719 RepID=A0A4P6KF93_9MICO|nr:FGGY-family carbohydrate kinase [Leucobacter triazinivorans]QBE48982.1 sugar kinase [Leucobacter triazinivorans]
MAAYVIAVDNGSQSTKVSIFDAEGAVHASARVALRPYDSPAPGRWEHPDDDLWTSIVAAIREALARFDGDASEIRALGLCTIRFCRAVLRADGSLAQPVMSWMDERVSRAYEAEAPEARYVTTSSGYIAHRLTGRFRDTAGNYQGVWPIDPERWDWSEDPGAYVRTGMRREQLFELVEPGAVLGGVTSAAAAETGLPQGLPVIATSNDKAVEALGAGLRSDREALLSLGTYVSVMMTGTRQQTSPEHAYWVNFGADPEHYLLESAGVRRGMWTVSWFRDLVSGMTEDELGRGAESVPPGADGLVVSLDWLAPDDEPHRRGAIVGFNGTQGRFHVYRAILEALAITMADNCERMAEELERRLEGVVVTGGGAASELMLSVLAAVFGVPVRRPEFTDAAGVGAAIAAAVAVGMHADWDRAVAAMVRPGEKVEPDPALVDAYLDVRERYARVVPRVRALFAEG